jgi:hypothetical protein
LMPAGIIGLPTQWRRIRPLVPHAG